MARTCRDAPQEAARYANAAAAISVTGQGAVGPIPTASQVEAFLARTPGAVAEPLDDRFGRVDGPGRQRLPGEGGMDGFFVARLRRG